MTRRAPLPRLWLAAAIYACAFAISFGPFLFGNASLLSAARDAPSLYPSGATRREPPPFLKLQDALAPASQIEPAFALEHHIAFDERRLPLWNRLTGFGTPLAANLMPQPFFPLTPLAAIDPSPRAQSLWVVCRLFVAAMLAFGFFRTFSSFWPALAGGASFGFTGYFLLFSTIEHVSVEMLLPGVFWAHEALLRKRSAARFAGLAFVTALVVLGGMPESTVLALGFGLVYAVARLVRLGRERASTAALDVAVATAGGACAMAFVVLPFLEFVRHSYSLHAAGSSFGVESSPFDLRIAAYLVPLAFGPPALPLSGFEVQSGPLGFAGVSAATFGLIALVCRRTARDTFFGIAAALLLLKRYGAPPLQWIATVPPFAQIFFEKYDEPLFAFAVAVLVASGLERIATGTLDRTRGALALACVLAGLTAAETQGSRVPGLADPVHAAFFQYAMVVGFATFALVAMLLLAPRRGARAAVLTAAVAAGLLYAECNADYLLPMYYVVVPPATRSEDPYRGAPYITYLQAHARADERVLGLDGVLSPAWAEAFGLNDPENANAIYPARYLPFVRAFLVAPGYPIDLAYSFAGRGEDVTTTARARRFLALASVRYVVAGAPLAAAPASFARAYANDAWIYRFDDPLPRAALFTNVERAADADAVLERLADPNFDIATTAVVELGPRDATALPSAREPVRAATIVSSDSERTTIVAGAPRPALLVYNDTNYPGWQAYVDGLRRPIVAANYLFRGVFLPAGPHRVEFRYEPPSYAFGYALSVIGVLGVAAYAFVLRRRPGRTA